LKFDSFFAPLPQSGLNLQQSYQFQVVNSDLSDSSHLLELVSKATTFSKMVFALPQSLLPDNKDLDIWLHQETRKAQVTDSPSCEKRQLPSDNLSTWLSTRYAANLTKKSLASDPEVTKVTKTHCNLDMWLAQKRRKLNNKSQSDLAKWLLPGSTTESQVDEDEDTEEGGCLRHKVAAMPESLKALTLEGHKATRLCPALANWEANASLPLENWLVSQAHQAQVGHCEPMASQAAKWLAEQGPRCASGTGTTLEVTQGDHAWLKDQVTQEVRSGFVFPDSDLPIQRWLVQEPKTPIEDGLQNLSMETSDNMMVESWIDQSQFSSGSSEDSQDSQELNQWLLVASPTEPKEVLRKASLADDGSSIVVLDNQEEEEIEDSKSVASSWKFW